MHSVLNALYNNSVRPTDFVDDYTLEDELDEFNNDGLFDEVPNDNLIEMEEIPSAQGMETNNSVTPSPNLSTLSPVTVMRTSESPDRRPYPRDENGAIIRPTVQKSNPKTKK